MTDISPIMIGSPETGLYKRQLRPLSIFDRSLIVPAIWASFRKLNPRTLVKNPVMFCVEIVSVLTTIFFSWSMRQRSSPAISCWSRRAT